MIPNGSGGGGGLSGEALFDKTIGKTIAKTTATAMAMIIRIHFNFFFF